MKRFLIPIFLIVLLAAGCKFNSEKYKEHWIAAQVYQDNVLLDSNYDRIKGVYYLNIDKSKPFELRYFLIPDYDEKIVITSIEYDKDTLEFISLQEPVITFKPIKTGIPYITIKTQKHGSTSPIELRIQ